MGTGKPSNPSQLSPAVGCGLGRIGVLPPNFPPTQRHPPSPQFSERVVTSQNHFLEETARSTGITCAKFSHCLHIEVNNECKCLFEYLNPPLRSKTEASGQQRVFPVVGSILCNYLPLKGLSSRESANPYPRPSDSL